MPSENGLDSLDRRCLSSSVTRARVEISSTIILTTISTIEGVREICVYILRRPTKRPIDLSKSAIASQLGCMPLAVWFPRVSQGYLHRDWRMAHTSSRIERPAGISFERGNDVCNKRSKMNMLSVPLAYQADSVGEGGDGRKLGYD